MNTEKELVKTENIVLQLLKDDERCRNDDKWITYKVMRRITNIYIPFEDFSKIPAFETVSRVRRKIQNSKGLFLPTDEGVIAKRSVRREVFAQWSKE